MPKVRNFTVLPALPDSLKDLEVIAKNMFWSWNPKFAELFKRVDNNLWAACGHNPVKLLGSVSQERLEELSGNKGFLCEVVFFHGQFNKAKVHNLDGGIRMRKAGLPFVFVTFTALISPHICYVDIRTCEAAGSPQIIFFRGF